MVDLIGDRVRVATVVKPENLCVREPELGIEEQKYPVLAEIHKRAVSSLLPPAMSCHAMPVTAVKSQT